MVSVLLEDMDAISSLMTGDFRIGVMMGFSVKNVLVVPCCGA